MSRHRMSPTSRPSEGVDCQLPEGKLGLNAYSERRPFDKIGLVYFLLNALLSQTLKELKMWMIIKIPGGIYI